MQKTLINTQKLIVDVDTVNLKTGVFNIENKKICIFLGVLQIFYYKWERELTWLRQENNFC